MGSVLDDRQVEQYQRDGFVVIEGFVDQQSCDDLKAAANRIVADFHPTEQRTVFTTTEQERVSNTEFLASGSGVWCFFEEEAFDDAGHLRTAKELSINKIGHA
ncbi:MAG TPA: phytanoyl-CoA dioxygenase family protein, partial [Ilumatobacteraceae bacterium]